MAAGTLDDGTIVRMRFEGSLVFANVAFFEEQLQKMLATTPDLKILISEENPELKDEAEQQESDPD